MNPAAPIDVRRLAPRDAGNTRLIDQIVRVFRDARRAHLQFSIDLHSADEDRTFFHRIVLPQQQVHVAETGGTVAGFIAFAEGWVHHLYVAPEFQGRGVGTTLLEVAKRANPSLQLWVYEVNEPAIRFYEKQGFRAVEHTDGAANEAKRPDVRMRWDARPPRADSSP